MSIITEELYQTLESLGTMLVQPRPSKSHKKKQVNHDASHKQGEQTIKSQKRMVPNILKKYILGKWCVKV